MDKSVHKTLSKWKDLIYSNNENKYKRELITEKYEAPTFENIVFPIARRVAAQTIGLDLVSVQPLSLPKGNLLYFDSFENENLYKRILLTEKKQQRRANKYWPNYKGTIFKSPGIYTREQDISILQTVDLVSSPSFSGATISGPSNSPTLITEKDEFESLFENI